MPNEVKLLKNTTCFGYVLLSAYLGYLLKPISQNINIKKNYHNIVSKNVSFSFFRYFPSVKKLLTNKSFIIMFFFVGGAMGYISCISTKIEQVS